MLPRTGGAYVFLRAAYGDAAAFIFGWLYLLVTTPGDDRRAGHLLRASCSWASSGVDVRAPGAWAIPRVAGRHHPRPHRREPARGAPGLRGADRAHRHQGRRRCWSLMLVSFTAPGGSFAHLAASPAAPRNLGWAPRRYLGLRRLDRGEHDRGRGRAPERLMRRIIVGGDAGTSCSSTWAPTSATSTRCPWRRWRRGRRRAAADHGRPPGADRAGRSSRAAILCSVFGALNGNILAKPRVAYALARDGLTFSFLGPRAPALGDAARRDPDPAGGGDRARRACCATSTA